MLSWLFRRLAAPSPRAPPPEPAPAPTPEAPPWAVELADAVQKLARAQARLGLKVDDLNAKVDGGFSVLQTSLIAQAAQPKAPEWDELFDAMDLLDTVARGPEAGAHAALAEGLGGVLDRLTRLLARLSLERAAPTGGVPDGRLFRVVGNRHDPSLPEGAVSHVVRAAVLRGGQLVREGEVLTNRSPP